MKSCQDLIYYIQVEFFVFVCLDVGSDVAAIKIQAAYRGFKDRQKVRHAKKAVVTIQATVRGFLTRRRLMKLRR